MKIVKFFVFSQLILGLSVIGCSNYKIAPVDKTEEPRPVVINVSSDEIENMCKIIRCESDEKIIPVVVDGYAVWEYITDGGDVIRIK